MSLAEFPEVTIVSDPPFLVTIASPSDIEFSFMAMPPEWLVDLQDQTIFVGEHLLYVPDIGPNQFGK